MIALVLGVGAGVVLGGLYFGALWLTVRRIPDARRPGLLVAGSYAVRLGVLGVGLVAVVRGGGAPSLMGALLGLLVIRQLMVARVGPDSDRVPGGERRPPGAMRAPGGVRTPDGGG